MSTALSLGQPRMPHEVLRRVFGFPSFRGLQEAVVEHVLAGGDALVLMPTGGGKSICYQVPALCRPGTAIVVSPLIALMDDQVAALRQLGVAAGALHSELDPDEAAPRRARTDGGRLDLLYVSPERLLGPGTLERLSRRTICAHRHRRGALRRANGATSSARSIASSRACPSAFPACRASR